MWLGLDGLWNGEPEIGLLYAGGQHSGEKYPNRSGVSYKNAQLHYGKHEYLTLNINIDNWNAFLLVCKDLCVLLRFPENIQHEERGHIVDFSELICMLSLIFPLIVLWKSKKS